MYVCMYVCTEKNHDKNSLFYVCMYVCMYSHEEDWMVPKALAEV
jgi:hypothetical protein